MRGLVTTVLVLTGCGGAELWPGPRVGARILVPPKDAGTFTGDGGGGGVPFQKLLAEVIVPTCAQAFCHEPNPPAAPMTLSAEEAYGELVGTASSQVPGLLRVKPGDPENSYLLIKLRAVSITDFATTQMPLNKPALDEATVADIEAWIARGAPND